ncbi:hypothetical protein [Heyndrickxia acidiproducens]|uniref:hypothetical protein n=1 Tax=Heyndrickxia acidiproducens TaxID=1121084 RepID=UPI000370D292|nr:hypothetical protein [Heyndrickxia acidiproducens]
MNDILLLVQLVAKRLSVLSLFATVLLFLSQLWLYSVLLLLLTGVFICVDRLITQKNRGLAAEDPRNWYTLIVVNDEDWEEEEHVPLFEMEDVSLELHYQYEDIRRINPAIQFSALPGFILVETDDSKRIEELLEKPAIFTSNYAEIIRFLKKEKPSGS